MIVFYLGPRHGQCALLGVGASKVRSTCDPDMNDVCTGKHRLNGVYREGKEAMSRTMADNLPCTSSPRRDGVGGEIRASTG